MKPENLFTREPHYRALTLIHELTHQFGTDDVQIPGTNMVAYDGLVMAIAKSNLALENADSYAQFAVDLTRDSEWSILDTKLNLQPLGEPRQALQKLDSTISLKPPVHMT